ncbi:2-keto-4-pentenoate hydratase [Rhizobium binxianense]
MHFELIDSTAEILAKSRRHETCCDLPLDRISNVGEAIEIQTAALDALGFDQAGYSIVGSSEASRRLLGLDRPIYSAVPADATHQSGARLRLPKGVIGAQCELAFTLLRRFPDEDEEVTLENAASAILGCRPAIGLLGRRTNAAFAGDLAAIADFGLHLATVCGPYANTIEPMSLDNIDVNGFLFRRTMVSGSTSAVFSHPLEAVVWLAGRLAESGRQLQAGDIVTTGSCTTILQVMPGQHLAADFGILGQVECFFR